MLDMIEMFWLEKWGRNKHGLTYYNEGLTLELKGEQYEYECLIHDATQSGQARPDLLMREKLIDQQFIVKYDPCDLSHVRLYRNHPTGGLQYVTSLEPRLLNPRAIIDYKPGSRQQIIDLLQCESEEIGKLKAERAKLEDRSKVYKQDVVYDYRKDYDKQVSAYTEGQDDEKAVGTLSLGEGRVRTKKELVPVQILPPVKKTDGFFDRF